LYYYKKHVLPLTGKAADPEAAEIIMAVERA
jgi:hypothetical protein